MNLPIFVTDGEQCSVFKGFQLNISKGLTEIPIIKIVFKLISFDISIETKIPGVGVIKVLSRLTYEG